MALSTIDRHLQEGKLCTILIWCLFLKSHPLGVIRLTKWTKPHSLALQGTYSLVHACKHGELKEFIHTQTVLVLSNIFVKESIIEHSEAQIK